MAVSSAAFVARLVPRDEMSMEDISISPSAKDVENMHYSEGDSDIEELHETSAVDMNNRGSPNHVFIRHISFATRITLLK